MSNPYAECSTEELLDRLKMAGRYPDRGLIEECLDRPEALTPELLEMMEKPSVHQFWMEGDPRWFGTVHAGKLLLAFQEPDAAPLFADLLRDPDRQTLLEWFDTDLQALGLPFVPPLIEIVQDDSVYSYGRNLSISALGEIARERVLEVLQAELPPTTPETGRTSTATPRSMTPSTGRNWPSPWPSFTTSRASLAWRPSTRPT